MHPATRVCALFASLLIACLSLAADDYAVKSPPPDGGKGLLFHASFDKDRRADAATGPDLPLMARYARKDRTAGGGTHVDGVFGKALTGRCGRNGGGYYDALGNIMPERGTVALHVRQKGMHYGFEPLWMQLVDPYYWTMYLRLSNKNNRLSAWFPNEVYKPVVLGAGKAAKLNEGEWHHIAVAWDQAYGARYYFDGKEVASNWGTAAWTSRGVDPDKITLAYGDGVAYDELTIFDRPLNAEQIRALAKQNARPGAKDFPPLPFDEAHAQNRLRERSWLYPDKAMPQVWIDREGLGANAIRQVVPIKARAVKKECNTAFDGKLGNGWPPLYNFRYANGNGLHVELGSPYDYVMIEGYFDGDVYGERRLLPERGTPIREIDSRTFIYRWPLRRQRDAGWLSFFKRKMEDKGGLPDKELVTTSRICELGFFQRGKHDLADTTPVRYYLGAADVDAGRAMLGAEFVGRYGPGDRAVLGMASRPADGPAGQALAALRYHHILIPPTGKPVPLRGLRLNLRLRGKLQGNALWVEVRDPMLPGRRLFGCDFALTGAKSGRRPRLLDLTLDLSDRLLPADKPLWIAFCFKQDVDLLWDGKQKNSYVELLTGTQEQVLPEYLHAELAFAKHRFRELSEPRPWGAHREPEKEMVAFNRLSRELFYPLVELRKFRPDDPKLQALWYWTHKQLADTRAIEPLPVPGCPKAPRWALLQRELLGRCRDVVHWWIENRQTPNGEFGDAWGDDTDLTQNFPKLALLGDPDGRIANAARRVADGVYRDKLIERGINRRLMDTLHAYEEGVNCQPVMGLIEYGNPKYVERMMEAAHTVDTYLTKKDVKGRRRFRSGWFGAEGVRDKGRYGIDHRGNMLFCHPALYLAYYSRNPRAVRFLREWIDGWLDIQATVKPPNPRTPFPSRTLMDGRVIGWDTKMRGYGFWHGFVALYHVTGDPKYADVAKYATGGGGPGGGFLRGSDYHAALELIDWKKWQKHLVRWAEDAKLDCPGSDGMGRAARERYMKWQVTGDEKAAYEALDACVRKMRLTFDAYTWGEPINDRIWLPDHPMIVMMQGEMSHERNQLWPRHYVSYSGFSDYAAWVRETSETHLRIWLYSFAEKPETGVVRFWRTPLGEYAVRFGRDGDRDGNPDVRKTRKATLHRSAALPLMLPPRSLCALDVTLVRRSKEDYWQRPDLGISAEDVRRTGRTDYEVTVHNLGNSPARNVAVQALTGDGKVLGTHVIPAIDAPLDLMPRTAKVVFRGVPEGRFSTVVLDPQDTVAELNELNNSASMGE